MRSRRASNPSGEQGVAAGMGGGAFPYNSAFTYSTVSPFPCGSDAVMINSTLAHKAFQGEIFGGGSNGVRLEV